MEAIKQYIESLFINLPNTKAVARAKEHLLEMAEDKYLSLKEEGISDNEAVAQVITEFGNLDELKDELGIRDAMNWQATNRQGVNLISIDSMKEIIFDCKMAFFLRGLGIMTLICCFIPAILFDSALGFFGMIAAGILLIVMHNCYLDRFKNLKKSPCGIDFATAEFVKNEKKRSNALLTSLRTAGILCVCFCWLPATEFDGDLAGAALFFMIGLGVLLGSASGAMIKLYDKILSLNPAGTYGSNYSKGSDRVVYNNPNLAAVMSIFWPLAVCLYFSVTCMTFWWGFTWIIFPLAAIAENFIKTAYGERE